MAVAILVVTMLLLGFWQLRRLDEKRDYAALVEARQAEPAVDVATVVPAGEAGRRTRAWMPSSTAT